MQTYCHCKACSRAMGTSPVALIIVQEDAISITKGKAKCIKGYGTIIHYWCEDCGTRIYQGPSDKDIRAVYPVNFHIDKGKNCLIPKELMPKSHCNYENRLCNWIDDLPKF